MIEDREYCDWLMAQDWFRTKFQPIYTVIINNFGEPEETPEHNQLQGRFTEAEFCRRFIRRIYGPEIDQKFSSERRTVLSFRRRSLEKRGKLLQTMKLKPKLREGPKHWNGSSG